MNSEHHIRVALVDDHRLFRKGMAAILNVAEGMAVILEAENGYQLLEEMDGGLQPDVVLLDLEMPVMDGLQTMTALRQRNADAKVILLTMHTDERFVLHFMESGANAYLLKDTHPEEVERAIRKVMETGFYFTDAVSKTLLKGLTQKKNAPPELPGNESLTEREVELLKLICLELTTNEIAERMFLSPRTIEGYRKKLLEKTGAKNTAGLVLLAVKLGIAGG